MVKNNRDPNKSHLDNLLADKPPQFQAKVLRFALDSGIKQNDPAFRLVQYIGYLAQLTETAPDQWKELFEDLEEELDEWRKATISQLGVVADNSQEIKNLATNCDRLGTTLDALDLTAKQLLEQMRTSAEHLTKSNNAGVKKEITALTEQLKDFQRTQKFMNSAIFETQSGMGEIIKMLSTKKHSPLEKKKKLNNLIGILNFEWNWGNVIGFVTSIVGAFILFWLFSLFWVSIVFNIVQPPVTTATLSPPLQETITEIYNKVDYNYTKLTRVEKALGTDPHQKKR